MAMAAPTDTFDLGRLRLSSGEGRRLTLGVRLSDFDFGGERYAVEPALVDATLDISRMTGGAPRRAAPPPPPPPAGGGAPRRPPGSARPPPPRAWPPPGAPPPPPGGR